MQYNVLCKAKEIEADIKLFIYARVSICQDERGRVLRKGYSVNYL